MNDSKEDFLAWLNSDPLPEDKFPLPWDMNITYIPIEVIRNKFEIMKKEFGAIVEQVDVSFGAINTHDKDTLFSACVKFNVYHPAFINGKMMVVGTASFLRGQYDKGWAYSQIAESLATTRAFSKQWKQFGMGLNKVDSISDMKSPTGAKKNNSIDKTLSNIK